MGDGKVYIGLGDASMSALDQSTGRQVWKNVVADWKNGYYFTNAPTYYKNMVITGISAVTPGPAPSSSRSTRRRARSSGGST
jgi:outer membrane protein assembly factor BamB